MSILRWRDNEVNNGNVLVDGQILTVKRHHLDGKETSVKLEE